MEKEAGYYGVTRRSGHRKGTAGSRGACGHSNCLLPAWLQASRLPQAPPEHVPSPLAESQRPPHHEDTQGAVPEGAFSTRWSPACGLRMRPFARWCAPMARAAHSCGPAGAAKLSAFTMDSRVERLTVEVLSLPTADRAELARRIIESLDDNKSFETGAASHAEALRRLDEIDRGIVEPISSDELFRRVRQRLAR